MAKISISYEFDLHEDYSEWKNLLSADELHCALWDVDQELRVTLKYGEAGWLDDEEAVLFLEGLREKIAAAGVLRDSY